MSSIYFPTNVKLVYPAVNAFVYIDGIKRRDFYVNSLTKAAGSEGSECTITRYTTTFGEETVLPGAKVEIKVQGYPVQFRGFVTGLEESLKQSNVFTCLDYRSALNNDYAKHDYNVINVISKQPDFYKATVREVIYDLYLQYYDFTVERYGETGFVLDIDIESFPDIKADVYSIKGDPIGTAMEKVIQGLIGNYMIKVEHKENSSVISCVSMATGSPTRIYDINYATDSNRTASNQPSGVCWASELTAQEDNSKAITELVCEGDEILIETAFELTKTWTIPSEEDENVAETDPVKIAAKEKDISLNYDAYTKPYLYNKAKDKNAYSPQTVNPNASNRWQWALRQYSIPTINDIWEVATDVWDGEYNRRVPIKTECVQIDCSDLSPQFYPASDENVDVSTLKYGDWKRQETFLVGEYLDPKDGTTTKYEIIEEGFSVKDDRYVQFDKPCRKTQSAIVCRGSADGASSDDPSLNLAPGVGSTETIENVVYNIYTCAGKGFETEGHPENLANVGSPILILTDWMLAYNITNVDGNKLTVDGNVDGCGLVDEEGVAAKGGNYIVIDGDLCDPVAEYGTDGTSSSLGKFQITNVIELSLAEIENRYQDYILVSVGADWLTLSPADDNNADEFKMNTVKRSTTSSGVSILDCGNEDFSEYTGNYYLMKPLDKLVNDAPYTKLWLNASWTSLERIKHELGTAEPMQGVVRRVNKLNNEYGRRRMIANWMLSYNSTTGDKQVIGTEPQTYDILDITEDAIYETVDGYPLLPAGDPLLVERTTDGLVHYAKKQFEELAKTQYTYSATFPAGNLGMDIGDRIRINGQLITDTVINKITINFENGIETQIQAGNISK